MPARSPTQRPLRGLGLALNDPQQRAGRTAGPHRLGHNGLGQAALLQRPLDLPREHALDGGRRAFLQHAFLLEEAIQGRAYVPVAVNRSR